MADIRLSTPMPPKIFTAILGPILETDIKCKKRRFSSFDFMPTILELMGYKLSEDGLAFGRSLLGNSKTLVELYDEEEMEKEILRPTVQYEALKRPNTEKN